MNPTTATLIQFRDLVWSTTQLISITAVVTPNLFAFLAQGSHNLTVTKVLINSEHLKIFM